MLEWLSGLYSELYLVSFSLLFWSGGRTEEDILTVSDWFLLTLVCWPMHTPCSLGTAAIDCKVHVDGMTVLSIDYHQGYCVNLINSLPVPLLRSYSTCTFTTVLGYWWNVQDKIWGLYLCMSEYVFSVLPQSYLGMWGYSFVYFAASLLKIV